MNLMHGANAIALNFAGVDLSIAIDMRRRHSTPACDHVFNDLSKGVVFFGVKRFRGRRSRRAAMGLVHRKRGLDYPCG